VLISGFTGEIESVVEILDHWLQEQGVGRRDFLAGSSVFPTPGQANPTPPAVALALRLGDFLRQQPL
jgi:hypothetical protein